MHVLEIKAFTAYGLCFDIFKIAVGVTRSYLYALDIVAYTYIPWQCAQHQSCNREISSIIIHIVPQG